MSTITATDAFNTPSTKWSSGKACRLGGRINPNVLMRPTDNIENFRTSDR
jgi:hypothetical protein